MQNNDWEDLLQRYFPAHLWAAIRANSEDGNLEEIRIRVNQRIQLVYPESDRLTQAWVTETDCKTVVERMCEHSLYAWREELRAGFITLAGGCRVGVCGKAVMQDGRMECITSITSLNIRIAREVNGAAAELLPHIIEPDGQICASLLFSAPGCGKTTLLRDIARQLSYGENGIPARRICVMDERMELAASINGVPQLDVGPRTDVLSGCPKAEGMELLIRSMNPQVLITDELGGMQDAIAVLDASNAGVAVITTAHAGSIEQLQKRPGTNMLLESGAFARIVQLGRTPRVGSVLHIWDSALCPVHGKAEG